MHPLGDNQQRAHSPGPATVSRTLWHYTCAHGDLGIGARGILLPPLWQISEVPLGLPLGAYTLLGLIWATDMDPPNREALGLTSATLSCDRTTHRYAVPARLFIRWGAARDRAPAELVNALERARGAQPARWWVTDTPVEGARRDNQWANQ